MRFAGRWRMCSIGRSVFSLLSCLHFIWRVSAALQVTLDIDSAVYTASVNRSRDLLVNLIGGQGASALMVDLNATDLNDGQRLVVSILDGARVSAVQLPLITDDSANASDYFYRRTLCPLDDLHSGPRMLRIHASTMSESDVTFQIGVFADEQFRLKLGQRYQVRATISENRFFRFDFPDGMSDDVVLDVRSDAPDSRDICATVFVLGSQCPADLDGESDAGVRQTILSRGRMLLDRRKYPNGFHVAYRVHFDDSRCRLTPSTNKSFARSKEMDFILSKTVPEQYFHVVVFGYTLTILVSLGLMSSILCTLAIRRTTSAKTWQIIEMAKVDQDICEIAVSNDQAPESLLIGKSNYFLTELIVISIFYTVPVMQFVYSRLQMMKNTGDQDLCYFNFACSYKAFGITDFNHFFSNGAYIIFAIVFVAISTIKNRTVVARANNCNQQCGTVPNFGLCCAMGLALAVEGLLSACYHLCPHSMTSQFDFTFMYIICTLCFLKLYYARKSQVEQGSKSAYVFLAAVVCLVSWKFLHEMTYFSSFLIIVHLLTCMLVSIEIYESGHMKFAYLNPVKIYYRLQTVIRQRVKIISYCYVEARSTNDVRLIKNRTNRLIAIAIINFVNYFLVIFMTLLKKPATPSAHVHHYILSIVLVNLLIMYTMYYIFMKLRHGELSTVHCLPLVYLLVSIMFALSGLWFYTNKRNNWQATAAESRMLNAECIVAGVYDNHDVWHFLSAIGLFFYFMFLLTVDDNLIDVARADIAVF